MSTGAGIAAAAGIGAFGSLLAAGEQSDAAKKAGDTQLKMYEQTRADLEPYRNIGYAALDVLGSMFIPGYSAKSDIDKRIASLQREAEYLSRPRVTSTRRIGLGGRISVGTLGRGGGEQDAARMAEINRQLDELRTQRAEPAPAGPDYSAFYKSPGYEFRFDEGMRAVGRGASARGRRLGGAHERELIRYGQGVASSEFNNYANRLASLAGLGQTSAAQTGSFGAAAAGAAGQYIQNQGTARASGYAGAANALTGGIGNYLFYAGLQGQGANPGLVGYYPGSTHT